MNRWLRTAMTIGASAVLFGVVAGTPAFARDDDYGYRNRDHSRRWEQRERHEVFEARERDRDRDNWRRRHEEERLRERRERMERERRRHEREEWREHHRW